ncbi:MAG: helix-turn-helix transcriptional regulator, partial [Erysipelotrichaceae bacterium]|nr:helix-turn-helix transcriptional regulator [Erysipelotrichaceae bacterium]
MESFGTRLANIRREHNLTQNDIADRLNVSAQAVSKWENDLTSPDINTIME